MDEIIIRNSKGSALIGLVIFIPLTLIGVYLLTAESTLMNWLVTLLFGGLTAICLWLYLDRRPRVIINALGITDARTKMGAIEWQDIKNLSIVKTNNTQNLQFTVADESKYLSQMRTIQKIGSKIDKTAGFGALSINVTGLEMSAEQIVAIIIERINRNKN